jgi:2-dehydropantoate 2-reductase
MRICIVGAGAIGGLLAVKLAELGEAVTVILRGANLAAVREHGMKLLFGGEEHVARLAATDRIAEAGPQDLVILALKAHQLTPVAAELGRLCGPETLVLTAQNGIPWWYFFKHGGPHEGTVLQSVDPGGAIAANLDAARVIGAIIYPAAVLDSPGVVRHVEGDRITLGELDGADTERLRGLVQLLRRAGFKVRPSADIRAELWVKLWGNSTFNPISALTQATLVDICQFAPTRALAKAMMEEVQVIGEKLGVRFPVSLEKRLDGAEAVGKHKPSTLQDVESGKPLEIDALVGSVLELGRLTGTPAPHLTAVYALVSLLAKTLQEEHGRLRVEKLQ